MAKEEIKSSFAYGMYGHTALSQTIVKAMQKYHFKLYVKHCLDTQYHIDFRSMIADNAQTISDPKYHVIDQDPFVYARLVFTLEGDILGQHQKLTNLTDYQLIKTIKKWITIKQANECLKRAIKKGRAFFNKPVSLETITIPVCSFGNNIHFYLWVDQTRDELYFKKKVFKKVTSGYFTLFDYRLDLINTADEFFDDFSASDNRPKSLNEEESKNESQTDLTGVEEKKTNQSESQKQLNVKSNHSTSSETVAQQISLF